MADKGYYYNKAKELVTTEMSIDMDIIDGTFTDIADIVEVITDRIDLVDFDNDDEKFDKERTQQWRETYQYLNKEHKKEIAHANRVKRLFEVMRECPQIMENFNDNQWDLLEELNDYTTNRELTTLEKFFLEQ